MGKTRICTLGTLAIQSTLSGTLFTTLGTLNNRHTINSLLRSDHVFTSAGNRCYTYTATTNLSTWFHRAALGVHPLYTGLLQGTQLITVTHTLSFPSRSITTLLNRLGSNWNTVNNMFITNMCLNNFTVFNRQTCKLVLMHNCTGPGFQNSLQTMFTITLDW